jgi:uncharacterized protein
MAVHSPSAFRTLPAAGFDWDAGNRAKCRRHGLTVGEIEALFYHPVAVFPDPAHSADEERFKAIGKSETGRGVLIVFTLRHGEGGTLIRPMSARYMHAKEVAHYAEAIAQVGQR